ncbi:polysaccharide biosynthesis/export family protein [Phaeovulum vinaykumarii]|uniref:Polysaccharide export outer membrane protein n=1 Tax=Phaeovulum vinaykumarii TaxID=407234 RepID=A0A1N7N243_9RHOB|nr:polysaccharide biosynthesis/export family protein [Phaeovulum vinaykumarii]SIS92437.1 polysaccharide export outer membrane protein [Phaeovulum vinaykumarii]SOC18644.1 polysaccharide export outer membrane protein [Phaeovulum vinaykumarii]
MPIASTLHSLSFSAPEAVTRLAARIHAIGIVLGLFLLAACSDGHVSFPLSAEAQRSLGDDVSVIILDPTNIANFTSPARGHAPSSLPTGRDWSYLVGPGDILSVIVFNHPDLTLPAGPQRSAAESGFQVGSDGTINYPYIGTIQAAGRRTDQIRGEISEQLATFIPDPQVEVRIAAYNAQAIVVSGEVNTPNRQPLTAVPLSLIEAVNAAGGFTDDAEPRNVSVQRAGRIYQVDVQGFLSGGLRQNNPVLRNGDVVSIPRRRAEEAYLLGEVSRPDVVDLSREQITLTQAITRRGGLQQTRADARGVLVFRADGARTLVFQLDTSNPSGLLLGTRFVLEPGDVVYVMRSPIQRWNDTISRLLPSVQAINTANDIPD